MTFHKCLKEIIWWQVEVITSSCDDRLPHDDMKLSHVIMWWQYTTCYHVMTGHHMSSIIWTRISHDRRISYDPRFSNDHRSSRYVITDHHVITGRQKIVPVHMWSQVIAWRFWLDQFIHGRLTDVRGQLFCQRVISGLDGQVVWSFAIIIFLACAGTAPGNSK